MQGPNQGAADRTRATETMKKRNQSWDSLGGIDINFLKNRFRV
jgi:hypothetical protein